ncbi:MAG: hypothetical protein K1Y36_08970 [Blastocatellia bacterium]|nr:hypothetical protein [Blastocatellia bacterium]
MQPFTVTRAHLKTALDEQNWDLLDKLLEIDKTHLNDNALYTDTWGEWWGLLVEAVRTDSVTGVTILLHHGAERDVGTWGDCIPQTPLELAQDKPAIESLLRSAAKPDYLRRTDPPLPTGCTPQEQAINRQGEIRDQTGLVFQTNEPE